MAADAPIAVQLCTISGQVITTVELHPDEVAADAMKGALLSAGEKSAEMLPRFLFGGVLISEDKLAKDIGFPESGVAEVSVVLDSRRAFQWKYCDEGQGGISEDGEVYLRGSVANMTHGVRTAACLPRGVKCHLAFRDVGSHACFGVGTESVILVGHGYQTLYGQDANSWAISFCGPHVYQNLQALHAGKLVQFHSPGAEGRPIPTRDLKAHLPRVEGSRHFSVSFMLDTTGSMSVWLPGDAEDMAFVVPFQVPQDQDVYVVASTVFGAGRIAISQTPIDESPEFHKRKRQEKDAADDTAVPATAEALPPG